MDRLTEEGTTVLLYFLLNLIACTFYAECEDADGDGYGNPSVCAISTESLPGYVTDNTDCDDTSASVNPGAVEDTTNGVDDDCDGVIDSATGDTGDTGPDTGVETGGDTGSSDSGSPPDTADTSAPDTGAGDTATSDSGSDTSTADTSDSGGDTGSIDTGTGDTSVDTGTLDSGTTDSGSADTSVDTGVDTGSDTGGSSSMKIVEVCVSEAGVDYELGLLTSVDTSHWVSGSATATCASPVLTGSASTSTSCVLVSVPVGGLAKFNGVNTSGSGMWGNYLVGACNGSSGVTYTDGSKCSNVTLFVDETYDDAVSSDAEQSSFCGDSYDLCWTD